MDHHESYFSKTVVGLVLLLAQISYTSHASPTLSEPTQTGPAPNQQIHADTKERTESPSIIDFKTSEDPPRKRFIHMGLGFPMLLELGLITFPFKKIDLDLSATYLPLPFIGSGTLLIRGIECTLQWHPTQQRFFLLTGLGFQNFQFNASINLGKFSDTPGPENGSVTLSRLYVPVGIGIQWIYSDRFYLESDIGIQLPILKSGKISFDSSSATKDSLEEASKDALSYYAGFILPRVTFIRFGIRI